MAHQSK